MDEGDRFGTTRVGAKCGRWNPTAEQVKVLTDLFRSGLRTPSTDQIQTISSHLSSFGKIESKNVFYWFQNHKARERHHKKRRRAGAGEDHLVLVPEKKGARTRSLPSNDGKKIHLDAFLARTTGKTLSDYFLAKTRKGRLVCYFCSFRMDGGLGVFSHQQVMNSKSLDQNLIANQDVDHSVQAKKEMAPAPVITERNHSLSCTNHFASLHGTIHNANSNRSDDNTTHQMSDSLSHRSELLKHNFEKTNWLCQSNTFIDLFLITFYEERTGSDVGRGAERNRDVGVVPIEVLRPGSREAAVNEKRVHRNRFPGSRNGSTVGSESELFVDGLIIYYSLAVLRERPDVLVKSSRRAEKTAMS